MASSKSARDAFRERALVVCGVTHEADCEGSKGSIRNSLRLRDDQTRIDPPRKKGADLDVCDLVRSNSRLERRTRAPFRIRCRYCRARRSREFIEPLLASLT